MPLTKYSKSKAALNAASVATAAGQNILAPIYPSVSGFISTSNTVISLVYGAFKITSNDDERSELKLKINSAYTKLKTTFIDGTRKYHEAQKKLLELQAVMDRDEEKKGEDEAGDFSEYYQKRQDLENLQIQLKAQFDEAEDKYAIITNDYETLTAALQMIDKGKIPITYVEKGSKWLSAGGVVIGIGAYVSQSL